MAEITMTFNNSDKSNISIQVGDIAYYVNTTTTGEFQTASSSNIQTIGEIISIETLNLSYGSFLVIKCNISNSQTPPDANTSYVFFSKDNTVNMASLLGYYGVAKFKNNSTEKAEMFATSCEINESSK